MKRLHTLDYLRGAIALGIMSYHYAVWTNGVFTADTFMGRLGIYGVGIFYLLSGLTLHFVYYDKTEISFRALGNFLKKRFLRLLPLLGLVTLISLVLYKKEFEVPDLFLNLSGLFGFVRWDVYFATGAWSIGNEFVFYAFFPFFMIFAKNYRALLILLSVVLFSLYLYYAFYALDSQVELSNQWRIYTNPLNQVFIFMAGFLTGVFLKDREIGNTISLALILIGLVIFIFYPASGNVVSLVTGPARLAFTLSCLLICIGFYKLDYTLPGVLHHPLIFLGDTSFSIYLLHPIVYRLCGDFLIYVKGFYPKFPTQYWQIGAMAVTLLVSYLVYEYFEKFFMKFGRSK
ncbi:acyltransferase family protein [Emticicia sp. CRIBPO]|uniref:acyltransferase family protein n=1 Tax=Emticicia sp. CRIBPO TaxID=2683258 RepID=UPI0014122550|nr:acyltransferase [Emticicia sp. CRIBPO]NBA85843.1 acyltransferase family protein [Emticicia sp. CRIBPO]